MHLKSALLSLFLSLIIIEDSQSQIGGNTTISSFENLDTKPSIIPFSNSLEISNIGGHLQGIQSLAHNSNTYFILSGSSSEYSYYSIVKTGEENMVISHNKILDKPFKHAGGFQVHADLMAIGAEDNDKKNTSKVFIFHIENPERPPTKPLAIIDRMGTYKRATAGCVGITVIRGKVLVVVGDWDTEHLDFYLVDEEKLRNEGATLELEYSINSKDFDKSTWTDPAWLSYQNINFILDQNGSLFLAGFGGSSKDEDVVDLFLVESENLSIFRLQKVFSRSFMSNPQTKFRWGAGISVNNEGNINIISCGEHIENQNLIHMYK